jgi:transcription termination/antitermination protein NusG
MVRYYAVHTLSGKEKKARDLLLNRAVAQKAWQNSIYDILIPVEKEYVTRNGQRKIVDKKTYPGYLFIKMILDKESMQLVKSTDGIAGFVEINKKPIPLEDHEVNNILKTMEVSKEVPKASFKMHDIVNIVSGAFADFIGKIESVDDAKGKVKAYVQVFGRETLVEFDIKDVELQK